MRGVSSRVAADLQANGLAGALDCSSEAAQLRAETARALGIRSRLAGPGAGKAAVAKFLHVIGTVLAIVAGPGLASLTETHLAGPAQYASRLDLRGSMTVNSDLGLRGSIR